MLCGQCLSKHTSSVPHYPTHSRMYLNMTLLHAFALMHIIFCLKSAPEQVHLSLGTNATEMLITWHTVSAMLGNDTPTVEYGVQQDQFSDIIWAETSYFKEIGLFTYRALLRDLKPRTQYYYRVGSNSTTWSETFYFRTVSDDPLWLPSFAIYGDLGYQYEESLPFLSKDVLEQRRYDVMFHIGDLAYDLYERDGEQGNDFMRSIEKVAARVPYMVCPGNHEKYHNFSHYDARFSMLGDRNTPSSSVEILTNRINNHFHSMDLGPAHIVMFSTEYYYYTDWGWDQIENQYHFLEKDLQQANANRDQRPWIILMGHRPLYCLKIGDTSCSYETFQRKELRKGVHMRGDRKSLRKYGLEELFLKYGVDVAFFGHEHFYARLLPIHDYQIKSGASNASNPYEDPQGPIHITTGSAGNRELHAVFNPEIEKQPWVSNHAYDYGYTRLFFKDRLQLVLEQTSDDKNGEVIDRIEISKSTFHPTWMSH